MPECEGEQGRKKGKGTQKCLETFTDRDYLERYCIYPLVGNSFTASCTQPEVKLRVHKLQCYKYISLFILSPLLLPVARELKKSLHLIVPSVSLCKVQEHLSFPKSEIFHSLLLISHCPNPNFEK